MEKIYYKSKAFQIVLGKYIQRGSSLKKENKMNQFVYDLEKDMKKFISDDKLDYVSDWAITIVDDIDMFRAQKINWVTLKKKIKAIYEENKKEIESCKGWIELIQLFKTLKKVCCSNWDKEIMNCCIEHADEIWEIIKK